MADHHQKIQQTETAPFIRLNGLVRFGFIGTLPRCQPNRYQEGTMYDSDQHHECAEEFRELMADPEKLREAIMAMTAREASVIAEFRSRLSPRIAMGILHGLAFAEIARALQMAKETTPSYLCGQARFLRGLIVSQPVDPDGIAALGGEMREAWQYLMSEMNDLWSLHFTLERLVSAQRMIETHHDSQQSSQAGFAAAYARTDVDIGFVEAVEERCRLVFTPLETDFVVPTFGLSVDQMFAGLAAIKIASEHRLTQLRGLSAKRREVRTENQWLVSRAIEQRLVEALEATTADLPADWSGDERRSFFEAFSVVAGEHNRGFEQPCDDNITTRKPLLRLSRDRYFVMDPLFAQYAPYRLLCHHVEKSPFRDRFLRGRDKALEVRAERLLSESIEPSVQFASYYLPVGANGSLAEHDLLFIADRHLFLVECKAKRLRSPLAHAGDPRKVASDLRESIETGFEQGDRARRHFLDRSGRVNLFDVHGNEVGVIDMSAVVSAHVIVVTWESFGPLSVDLQPWLRVPAGTEYPWVVWIDDLKTALPRLKPADNLAKFIQWRSGLNGRFRAADELHVVGCYLVGHTEFPPGVSIAITGHYGRIFDDDYFAAKGRPRSSRPPDARPALVPFGFEQPRSRVTPAPQSNGTPSRWFKKRRRR